MAQLTTGVKITVDATELDVKFLKTVEQLNAGLTKTQKALKLQYNEQGLLVNSLGQCVEGLSNAQIRLGEYVDIMGRVHTIQGGFIDGLNRSQIAMGQYTDELGNIYNAAGKVIGQTEKAARALEKEAASGANAAKAFDGANEAAASAEVLAEASERTGASLKKIGEGTLLAPLTNGINDAVEKFEALQTAFDTIKTARAKFKSTADGVNVLQVAFAAASKTAALFGRAITGVIAAAGPIPVLLAAAAGALYALKKSTATPDEDYWSDSFREIAEGAYAAGVEVNNLKDALAFGAFAKKSGVDAAIEEYINLQNTGYTKEERARIEHYKNLNSAYGDIMAMLETASDEFDHAFGSYNGEWGDKAIKEQRAAAMDEINGYIETILEENKTERDRLEAKLKTANAARAIGELTEEQQKTLDKEIKKLSTALKDETLKEIGVSLEKVPTAADKFAETLDKLAEARKKERIGDEDAAQAERAAIDKYIEEIAKDGTTKEEARAAEEELTKAYRDGRISQEALDEANKKLAETREQQIAKERADLEKTLGFSLDGLDPKFKELAQKYEALDKALADEAISAETHAELKKRLQEKTREEWQKRAENELGIKLNEKTPAQTYKEDRAKLDELKRDGTIETAEQYEAAVKQLKQKTLAAIPGMEELIAAEDVAKSAQEIYAETMGKIEAAAKDNLFVGKQKDDAIRAAKERLKKAIDEEAEARRKARDETLEKLGFGTLENQAKETEKSDPFEEARKAWHKINNAFRKHEITAELYEKAQKNWLKIKQKHDEKEAADAAKQRAEARKNARSELGVDALMESLKTPLEKYRETMDKIEAAAKGKAITKDERAALEAKAENDYWEAMKTTGEEMKQAAEQVGKFELAQSMSGGSEALYLAQVRNSTASYQTRMQGAAEKLTNATEEANYLTQQSNLYLQTIAENGAGAGVFG